MTEQADRIEWTALAPGISLTAAHAVACLSLLTFRLRVGEFPLHPLGFVLYLALTLASIFSLAVCVRSRPGLEARLLLVGVPVITSLGLFAALWWTPWLGGATYAPYDPGDPDVVQVTSLAFAVALAVVAVIYGSWRYLLAALAVQVALYFGTHALPHWRTYPGAGLLGPQPLILAELVALYVLAAVLLYARQRLLHTRLRGAWPAAAVGGLVAAWALYLILLWWPGNGVALGYAGSSVRVPSNAWTWSHPVAQALALASIVVIAISGAAELLAILSAVQARRSSRPAQPPRAVGDARREP